MGIGGELLGLGSGLQYQWDLSSGGGGGGGVCPLAQLTRDPPFMGGLT